MWHLCWGGPGVEGVVWQVFTEKLGVVYIKLIIIGSYISGSYRDAMNGVNLIFRVTELYANLYKVWYQWGQWEGLLNLTNSGILKNCIFFLWIVWMVSLSLWHWISNSEFKWLDLILIWDCSPHWSKGSYLEAWSRRDSPPCMYSI